MAERYERPPVLVREPLAPALRGLPFRLLLLALAAALVWLVVVVVAPLLNAETQEPGTISLGRLPAAAVASLGVDAIG